MFDDFARFPILFQIIIILILDFIFLIGSFMLFILIDRFLYKYFNVPKGAFTPKKDNEEQPLFEEEFYEKKR